MPKRFKYLPLLIPVLLTLAPIVLHRRVGAERLPIRLYTTTDGLPRDQVNRIVRDSRGFLWFCTPEGLSRFDGYEFKNYTTDQGLPTREVNDLLETRSGTYWVATNKGVTRFNPLGIPQLRAETIAGVGPPSPDRMFVSYLPNESGGRTVNVLFQDRAGTIWCGTSGGLYQLDEADGQVNLRLLDLGMPQSFGDSNVQALVEDQFGVLWIGAQGSGLYSRSPDGRTRRYTIAQGLPSNDIEALLEDRDGQLWAGTVNGLCLLLSERDHGKGIVGRVYTTRDGLPDNWVFSLFQSSDGGFWVGSAEGMSQSIPGKPNGQTFQSYTTNNGLSGKEVKALAEDRDGNLWIASDGAMKLAHNGFTTYNEADGLGGTRVHSIFEDRAGDVSVVTASPDNWLINQFDGKRFISVRPGVPKQLYFGWGWNQITFQDHTGEWWVATGHGLYRFPRVSRVEELPRTRPVAVYTERNGLVGDDIFRLYEDTTGDVWIVTIGTKNGLSRWERATNTLHTYSEIDGLPSPAASLATAFCVDASGDLWMGMNGNLARFNAGRFRFFTDSDLQSAGWIRSLYSDGKGRLWIATSRSGVFRLDNPATDQLHFVKYTTIEGLSSNSSWSITEDRWGHIYVGTSRGLDRLDPATGYIEHYTTADGLIRGEVEEAFRDHEGSLWFGTTLGLSRLVPEPERPPSPPTILISELRVAGVEQRVSQLGETSLPSLDLRSSQNHIQINFLGLSFGLGEVLRYQYKLEGADRDWGALTDHRTVNYANLSPGRYRFAVRAVSADGLISPKPATIAFTILPPIWERWWFVTVIMGVCLLVAYSIHRYRLVQSIKLERVRTRIAADLHDDIGAGLSRMAILSEVVKQQIPATTEQSTPMLTEIADSARVLVDSMRDIVWAIDPRCDDLSNLVYRIRQFASDVLEAKNIQWSFQVPPDLEKVKLEPEQRRQIFLIFKEAISNIAHHSGCKSASLTITLAHGELAAEIRDDGRGFLEIVSINGKDRRDCAGYGTRSSVPARRTYGSESSDRTLFTGTRGGHGLRNMQIRAAQLGGRLYTQSSPGGGACLNLTLPLRKP